MAFSPGHFWEGTPALGPVQWPWARGRGEGRGVRGDWGWVQENGSRWSGPVRWSQRPQPEALPILYSQPRESRWVGWG